MLTDVSGNVLSPSSVQKSKPTNQQMTNSELGVQHLVLIWVVEDPTENHQ